MPGYCCLLACSQMRGCGPRSNLARQSWGASLFGEPRRMTNARVCGDPSRRAKCTHLRMTSVWMTKRGLIPCDDLALALVEVRRVQQIATAPPHQEFRPPRPDRVVTATG